MRTQFRDTEQSAVRDNGEQKSLQEKGVTEENNTKDANEKRDASARIETPEDNICRQEPEDHILDDDGNIINENDSLPPNKSFKINGVEYKTDDNGIIYSIDGKYIPGSTFQKDGHEYTVGENGRICKRDGVEYRTDDNGDVYRIDGRNVPNANFVLNGKQYQTDENGKLKCFDGQPLDEIDYYALDKADFNELKCFLSDYYADKVNSNKPWKWYEIPSGETLTAGQKEKIIEYARETGAVPVVPVRKEDEKTYADFSEHVVYQCTLDKDKWKSTDTDQFADCNQQLKADVENDDTLAEQFTEEQLQEIKDGKTPSGYTWHHSEKDGVMQLVPFGVHNSTFHNGGRSEGNWADAPRN